MSAEYAVEGSTISVGQLRQNPTAMIRAIKQGEEYVLTDRGVPTARIVPFRPHRWVPADQARAVLGQPRDQAWIDDIEQDRASNLVRDPWEGR